MAYRVWIAWLRALLLVGLWLTTLALPAANGPALAQTSVGATLSVLAPPVEVAPAGPSLTFVAAQDGQTLRPGDRVRTGPGGLALLTFFDGTETQLTESTQIELDTSSRGSFQSSGTSVNRVRVPAGVGFSTDTAPATALVRGTTYLVTVRRLPGPAAPVAGTDAAASAALRAPLLEDQSEFTDDAGEQWRKSTWQDPNTGATWDTFDDLGPAEQTAADQTAAGQMAAAQDAGQPLAGPAACARTDVAVCLESTILLADPDGHVGRVGQVPHNPLLPSVDLASACQVGAVAARVATATLSPAACALLQQSVLNLRDVAAARRTAQQADEVATEMSGAAAPGSPPPPPGPPGPPPPGGPGQVGPPSVLGPSAPPPPGGSGTTPPGSTGAGTGSAGGSGAGADGGDASPPETGLVPPVTVGTVATWSSTVATRFGIDEGYHDPTLLAETSATWERLVFPWSAIQPDGPADFSRLDQTLPAAELQSEVGRGLRPAGLLQFTPAWAAAHPEQGQRSAPRNLELPFDDPNNAFGRFVYETVKRYSGRVDEWIVWNEPEFKPGDSGGGGSFTWLGSDAEFAQLLKVAYLAAKKANPNATVAFPGTSYWVDQNAHRTPFYERILGILRQDPQAASANWYHDAVAVNLYRDPDDVLRIHAQFDGIQHRFGLHKPLWLTESNAMPTDDTHLTCRHNDDPIQTTMEQQAAYAIQAFALAAAAGYERAAFYQMVDDNPCQQPAVWGAVRDDGSRRPVADALRTAITNFNGFSRARFVPRARPEQHWSAWPDDPDSYVPNWQVYQVAFDKPGGQRITVLWNGDGAPVCVRLGRAGSAARAIDKRGAPLALDVRADATVGVTLGPATAHAADDPAGYYFIGGDPVLVVEDGVPSDAPVVPTTECV